MKSITNKLIWILKLIIDIAWYGNILLAVFAAGFLGFELLFDKYVDIGMEVQIPRQGLHHDIQIRSELAKDVKMSTTEANLSFRMENTSLNTLVSIGLFLAIEALIISILYHLRKIFGNLRANLPFNIANVISLKRVSFFVALIYPLQFVIFLFQQVLIASHFNTNLSVKFAANVNILIIAAILFIVAEIFNQGLKFKIESEEFV